MDRFAALPNDLWYYPELDLQELEVMHDELGSESTDSEDEDDDVFLPNTFGCLPFPNPRSYLISTARSAAQPIRSLGSWTTQVGTYIRN